MSHARALLADAERLERLLAAPAAWCQHRDIRHDYLADGTVQEQVCLQGGALRVTYGEKPRFVRLMGLLQWVMWFDDVIRWNDDARRTHDDVVALLAAAVREARSRLELQPNAPPPMDRLVAADDDLHRGYPQHTPAAALVGIGQ